MAEEKRGFVSRILDSLDSKLEKKAEQKPCCCKGGKCSPEKKGT
ncbi:Uncharacterised protein [uncultured archaeon]|nr:Uncharacterised protein [uncultured archaeon]